MIGIPENDPLLIPIFLSLIFAAALCILWFNKGNEKKFTRKEFFRATIEEGESAVLRLAPEAELHRDIEAKEFRETLSRRKQALGIKELETALEYPDEN